MLSGTTETENIALSKDISVVLRLLVFFVQQDLAVAQRGE
jgi:hypothetical protein